ncbi:MAG: phosphate signaling complex protein PhoU [Oscillospiraceae bacterium]|nr:phosphate signaling complex protein PhoU [Oscillospiraceae bacterium]
MRNTFDKQLILLNDRLLEMGAMIEGAIAGAVKALVTQDVALAREVFENDDSIDEMEKEIESICLKLILQQQPVARDLRLISTVLKMLTDMERIGDHAADISEITLYLAEEPFIKKLEDIPKMAETTIKMVNDSLDAFARMDEALAKEVIQSDDIVDDLFDKVKNDLAIMIHRDVDNAKQAMDLLMIAKYFERIGDHAVNIAEWVLYCLTGKH